ncbi:hypothetical protein GUJ93_ZPchr0008g12415 [Zizania palustris]|uniref:USP domain-containing protein n=1 Tax=Zizania palustris TaxID=103762 RepID=A0A8J5RDC8_ZIZPA|nr:hypothetical protein GUJ93_ZPchr0008g12415 [Zizania palustris]
MDDLRHFFCLVVLAISDVMDEEKKARAGDAAESPWRPGTPAAAVEVDCDGGPPLLEPCEHTVYEQDYIDWVCASVRNNNNVPMCKARTCAVSGNINIMVCMECEMRYCVAHAPRHASMSQHWVALGCWDMSTAHCYECGDDFNISDKKKDEPRMEVDTEAGGHASWLAYGYANAAAKWIANYGNTVCLNSSMQGFTCPGNESAWGINEWGTMFSNEAGGHASQLADGHAHAIKGIPNFGNTCYLNSLVQCLLVLGKLRERMLGPDAPTEFIGVALHDLFVNAENANNSGVLLDPSTLLACVRSLSSQFEGTSMQDSHEVFCFLRDGLNENRKPPNMQDSGLSAVAPTFIDSIFGGQLSVTTSCKCCSYSSVSHDVFYDLSVPVPPRGSPAKSVELKLVPTIDKSNTEKIHNFAEGSEASDYQSPASELDLEDVFMVKTSEPLKDDCTKVEHTSQRKDDAHGPLQTQKEAQGQIIQVPIKAVDFLPQNMLLDAKVEGMDVRAMDSHIPEDIGPPPPVSPIRKGNARITSDSDIEENDGVVIDNEFNESGFGAEAKTFSEEVISKGKGKSCSSSIVYNEVEDNKSLASIAECLELHFKAEMVEWTCENCSKVTQKPLTVQGKYCELMMSSTNEDKSVGHQTEQSEMITCQDEQSSNLNSLAVEGTSSSKQPDGSDAHHKVMLTVDSVTKGITPGTICDEQDLASDNIANKKPECHEGVQEVVPSCVPGEKQSNMLSGQDQNASTLDEGGGKEVNLHHSAHQEEENQSGQNDTNKGGIQTCLISKLPSVLVIHLKRSLGPHKVIGHVSFKEILDVGLFMDPRY